MVILIFPDLILIFRRLLFLQTQPYPPKKYSLNFYYLGELKLKANKLSLSSSRARIIPLSCPATSPLMIEMNAVALSLCGFWSH